MNRFSRIFSAMIVTVGLGLAVGGCVYYPPAPGAYATTPQNTFDYSWSAAIGAMGDEGVQLVHEDRATGNIRGSRGGITVTAIVRSQADGSVRVEFNTAGNIASDPSLIDRLSRSYNRRMGR